VDGCAGRPWGLWELYKAVATVDQDHRTVAELRQVMLGVAPGCLK
jgi:hypothetical protein